MKKAFLSAFPSIILACGLGGLIAAEPPEKGFRFPGGDAEAGREMFVSLKCIQCHSVAKVELPVPEATRRLELTLAGKTRFVKKYEDIITAILNPKHVMTEQYKELLEKVDVKGSLEPLMPDLTKDMTVRQLMDIVAFLNEAYTKALPDYGK